MIRSSSSAFPASPCRDAQPASATPLEPGSGSGFRWRWLGLAWPLFSLLPLAAQSVLAPAALPPVPAGSAPAAGPGSGISGLPATSTATASSSRPPDTAAGPAATAAAAAPFSLGAVGLRPHLGYRYTHGDGVLAQPGRQVATTLHEVAPGLTAEMGRWFFDYTARQSWYSRADFQDTLGHTLNLNGTQDLGAWGLGFSQSYSRAETPLVETARQTLQENATTQLQGVRPLGAKLGLALNLTQKYQSSGAPEKSCEWSSTAWLDRPFAPHLHLGVGAGAGYVDLAHRPDLSFSRLLARASWQPAPKFHLSAFGGVEGRHDRAPDAATARMPHYALQLGYEPFAHTRLSAEASRSAAVSYFRNQMNDATEWAVSLNQRLLGKFAFTASYHTQRSRFLARVPGLDAARRDTQRGLSLRLGVTLRTRGSVGVSYQRRTNASSLGDFGFGSDQIGVDLGWHY